MMKKIILVIPVLILSVVIYLAWPKPGPDIFKVDISKTTGEPPAGTEDSKPPPLILGGTTYYYRGNHCRPGRLVELQGTPQKIRFQPELRGEYTVLIPIRNLSGAEVDFRIYLDEEPVIRKIIRPDEEYHWTSNVSLSRRHHFTILADGRGPVLLYNPVFYRKIEPEKRNYIFLVCADTLRADHLKVYGYDRETAPNITRWAEDCVLFEEAYAQSSWTLPSHMSLFTGLYEYNHGVRNETRLSNDIDYLVEQVGQFFATRSFNGGAYVSPRFGFCRGFDFYQINKYDMNARQASQNLFRAAMGDLNNNDFPHSFYFLHTYQVHSPYNPYPRHVQRFTASPQYLVLPRSGNAHSVYRNKFQKKSPGVRQNFIDLYDAEIYNFDLWFGRFLSYLRKTGIYHRSMIVFFSDHGDEFFEHGGWDHTHTLYNELIKVPLLIKFPEGLLGGKRFGKTVGIIDIMPTILSFYDIDYPSGIIDGLNLMDLIKGKTSRDYIISSNTTSFYVPALPFKVCAIEGINKMIYNLPYTSETTRFFRHPPPPVPPYEFYRLDRDPLEGRNIFSIRQAHYRRYRPVFQDIIQKARMQLKKKLETVEIDQKMREKLKSLGYL